jgi:hypothetical protein
MTVEAALSRNVNARQVLLALFVAPVVCGAVALAVLLLSGFALVLGPILAGMTIYLYARRSLIASRAWILASVSAVLAVPAVLAWMLLALAVLVGDGFSDFE